MRVGSIVYATEQGLGYLAKDFFDNRVVNDVFVLSHSTRRNLHQEWYPGAGTTSFARRNSRLREFCSTCDVMLFFETPFDWTLINYCREKGIKTVLMPMHECMPARWPARPDAVLNPSALDHVCFPEGTHIPVPVPNWVKWERRTAARTFVHNAGHGGLRGRNGTQEVLEAWRHVRSDAQLIVRTQEPRLLGRDFAALADSRMQLEGAVPQTHLYATGDVFLFPEKFNGLSLPLQEAFASGMIVLATDRFPMNTWLPRANLARPSGFTKARVGGPYREFDEAEIDPRTLAAKVDELFASPNLDLFSEAGRQWAAEHSWEKLKPRYMEFLNALRENGGVRPV